MRQKLLFFGLLVGGSLFAQEGVGRSAIGNASLTYANDYFTATDRYFTQGVGVRFGLVSLGRSVLVMPLLHLRSGPTPLVTVVVQQDCYTPASIRTDTIRPDDRPFAGALYTGLEAVSVDPVRGLKVKSSLSVGVIGPCAACGEEQRWIHHGLGNIAPLGWQYQVAQDVLLNYGAEVEKRLFRGRWAEARGGVNGEVGTYRDDLGTSFTLELGPNATAFADEAQRHNRVQFKAYGRCAVQAVAYDASMQGGVFQRDNPHTLAAQDIERIVAGYGWGARGCLRHAGPAR